MKIRPLLALIVAVVFAAAAVFPLGAQSRAATKPASRARTVTAIQALPFTCAQAWAAAHKTYPEALAIVTTLAKVSLANRNLTFPNTREAGLDAGKGIADDCKADPDALLFAIVDKHVRRVAGTAGGAK
jgi:hypothetical protein